MLTSSELNNDLIRIKERLNQVEDVLHNVDIGAISIYYISKFVLPSTTQYRTVDSTIDQQILEPEKYCHTHIFILQPEPNADLEFICEYINKYIGQVYTIRYVWSIRHQSIVICVRLQYWYVDKFSQILRSELIIQQELNKFSNEKQPFCITTNKNRRTYKVMLGRRIGKTKLTNDPPQITPDLNVESMPRVLI